MNNANAVIRYHSAYREKSLPTLRVAMGVAALLLLVDFGLANASPPIITGGEYVDQTGRNQAWHWKDGTCVSLDKPIGTIKSCMVYSLAVSGPDIYAGGSATDSSGMESAGYWAQRSPTFTILLRC
ncbi:MAG: hypothetical protein ABSG63_01265 [Spirochaetia bacterium]|jgi:hypothetical protein